MLPNLSNEQMRIVKHGLTHEPNRFEWVDQPVGKQNLPAWLTGSKIWWGGYYNNSPMLSLKTWRYDDPRLKSNEHAMPNWYKQEQPGCFVDRHPDGRVRHLTHSSPIIYTTLQRYLGVTNDGKWTPRYEDYQTWATRDKQAGFGGSTYPIRECLAEPVQHSEVDLQRGAYRHVELRGPWHSSPPADCVECASGLGGLTITVDLFMRIFATYHPWHKLALVTKSGITTLDVVHSDWPAPKQFLPKDHPVWKHENNPYAKSTT